MKGRACTSGEEQAPPIPLKKKTGKSATVLHAWVWIYFENLQYNSYPIHSVSHSLVDSFLSLTILLPSLPLSLPPSLCFPAPLTYSPSASLPLSPLTFPLSFFPASSLPSYSHDVQGDSEGLSFWWYYNATTLYPHGWNWTSCSTT